MAIYYWKWRLFHGYFIEPKSCWLSDVVACPVCSLAINKQYVAVAAVQPQPQLHVQLQLQFSHLVIILMCVCVCAMAYYCLSRCKREILIGVSCPNEIPAWNIFWHDIERIEAACSETECVINFLGICLALTFIVCLMCNFNNRFPLKVPAARRTLVQHLQLNSPACTSACLPPSLPACLAWHSGPVAGLSVRASSYVGDGCARH